MRNVWTQIQWIQNFREKAKEKERLSEFLFYVILLQFFFTITFDVNELLLCLRKNGIIKKVSRQFQ